MPSLSAKERILVVDDSSATLEVIQRNLAAAGYQAFTASGVAEAIEILNGTELDLVITDLKMEKIDGMKVLDRTKKLYPDTEVIMITGYAPSIDGHEFGDADGYLMKPFRFDEIDKLLKKLPPPAR